MKRTLILACALVASFTVLAQDGAPAGLAKKAESAPAKVEQLDPAAQAWVETLAKRIVDSNQVIRDSSIAALERVGKPAIPTLNALVSGSDKALAEAAKKLVDRINRGPQAGQGRGPGNMAENISKELKLDEQKTQKLKDLEKTMRDKTREAFEAVAAGDLTREEAREEMKQNMDDMKKELRKFLSEDEAKKVEESLGRMGGGMGGGGRRGPPAGGEGGGEGGGNRRRGGGGGQNGGGGGK